MTALSPISHKHVRTIPAALKALTAMERQLSQSTTYTEIRKIIDAGKALQLLFKDVEAVRFGAEDMILAAGAQIGEEIERVPKAGNRFTARGKSVSRNGAMPSGTSRARYMKLAGAKADLKTIAKKLRAEGKDATVTAVVRELTQGSKKQRRAERERDLAQRQRALPDKKYGVIYADCEWKFETWSEAGMDRSADNHYPTSVLDVLKARDVRSIAADDCVLFFWRTAPMSKAAHEVIEAWGFRYVSEIVWNKNRIGTGYWSRNKHEVLMIATRGKPPAPAMGTQWPSVIEADVGQHSEKPEAFAEMIEAYFPNLPKIELNARGKPRDDWDAWGNEVEKEAADD